MDLNPSEVLATWAAGVAAAASAVALWRIVGPGYVWLAGASTLLFGVPAALAGAGAWAWVGAGLAVLGVVTGRRAVPAAGALFGAAASFLIAAVLDGPAVAAVTGALVLGGVTGTMMLGHWYLVDPRLPRWALRRLAAAGGAGMLADVAATLALGALPWAEVDVVLGVGHLLLAATTVALMGMVWAALGEEGYSGVMAATGLSYLGVLTAIGAVVIGRLLGDGPVLG